MAVRVGREEAVASMSEIFRRYGYEGASLKRLSDASGLGRSSLYHHFPNGKEDMAAAVRDWIVEQVRDDVISVLRGEGDPQQRLSKALQALSTFYAGGRKGCLIEFFSMAGAQEAVPGLAQSLAEPLMASFQKLGRDAGFATREAKLAAEQALVEFQGGLVVARAVGTPEAFTRALKRIEALFQPA